MVAPIAIGILLCLFLIEACYLWLGRLEDVRREQAYWDAKASRPVLYDWQEDGW